jgi:Rv0078B-related antitoxin
MDEEDKTLSETRRRLSLEAILEASSQQIREGQGIGHEELWRELDEERSAMGEDRLDPRRIEVIDDETARMLKAKTGAERLAIASAMYSSARRMLISHLRDQHPDWCEEEILREAAHRLSHGAV